MSQISQFIDTGVFIQTITGNAGGAVGPAFGGNIDFTGGTYVTVTGTPATNSLVITLSPVIPASFITDVGTATPAVNALTVTGGTNINTAGAAATVTINLDDTITLTGVNATTFDTNIAAAGLTISGTTISADGTNPDISINITSKGAGTVIIDELQLTTPLAVADGGTGVNTLLDHGILLGSGAADVTVTAVGATGEILIGNTTADPSWSSTPSVTSLTATTVYATTFDTNVASAAVTLAGTSLIADGTDAAININITPKGTGVLATTELTLTTDLAVQYGGTGASTLTDHGVLIGNAANAITATAEGATLQILTGVTGNPPAWSATPTVTSVNATTFDTNVAGAAVTLSGTTLSADGTDADISINITAKGTGKVIIDDLQLTTDLAVTEGGTGASTLTDHGVLIGNGTGAVTATAEGATGTVLIGTTGAVPSWSANPTVTSILATTFDTNVAAAAVTLSGTTLSADGTDADININITAKGTGKVIIDDLQLTTDLAVTEGGTGVSTLTDHGLLVGSGVAAIDALAVGGAGVILTGVAGADPTWTTATYPATVAIGDVLVASNANVIGVVAGAATATYVLTANGAGTAPTFQANPQGTVTSVGGGVNITASGTAAAPVMDLDASISGMTNVIFATGGAIQTGIVATNTFLLQAYDTNLTGYVTFATLTANDVPTCDLSTDVTIAGNYIYRATGTDIPVTDGGTGASTLTDHGVLIGNATNAVTATAEGATGTVLIGTTANPPSFSANPTVTSILATTFDTNVAAAGVTLAGTTLSADGTDVDININITAKGTGQVIIDDLQLTTDLTVPYGGTGASTFTDGGLLVGAGAGAIEALSVGGVGTLLTGVAGSNPTWTTATYPATVAIGDVLVASAANVIGVVSGAATATWVLTANGAGSAPTFQAQAAVTYCSDAEAIAGAVTNKSVAPSSLKAKLGVQTSHGLPYGAGDAAAIVWTAEPSDGQILIGDTAGVPVLATLTEGSNVTITNGAGSITIASAGALGISWTEITAATVNMSVESGYILNRGTLITATLPAAALVGEVIAIVGKGAGGWLIAQNASQIIHFAGLNTTTGAGGSLASTAAYDCIELVCIVEDLEFVVRSAIGNITVV